MTFLQGPAQCAVCVILGAKVSKHFKKLKKSFEGKTVEVWIDEDEKLMAFVKSFGLRGPRRPQAPLGPRGEAIGADPSSYEDRQLVVSHRLESYEASLSLCLSACARRQRARRVRRADGAVQLKRPRPMR